MSAMYPAAEPDRMTQAGAGLCRVLVSVFAYNEGEKIHATLERFPVKSYCDVLIVDDGSTDGSLSSEQDRGFTILRNVHNEGLGASIKKSFQYALENDYDVIVIMAGNGKDDPSEIGRLLDPILTDECDFVQGSRFLPGGHHGNMPFYRLIATKYVHPILFSILSGTRVTESTNGFRALRTSLLRDTRINWEQGWLNQYELEQYLHFQAVRFGYRRKEVPVSKVYPAERRGYTKVKAFSGWWSMIKPVIYLALGIKR